MLADTTTGPADRAGDTAFRDAMGHLAAAVVMVTTHLDGRPWGLTVSACCSVSMSPPMLLVSIGSTTASAASILEDGRFGVSILGRRSREAARFGSMRGAPKFVDAFCDPAPRLPVQTPVVAGSIAHVDCAVDQAVLAGDHTVFIGRVQHVLVACDDAPLLYYDRCYHHLDPWPTHALLPN